MYIYTTEYGPFDLKKDHNTYTKYYYKSVIISSDPYLRSAGQQLDPGRQVLSAHGLVRQSAVEKN
jgi:hypothetical protein